MTILYKHIVPTGLKSNPDIYTQKMEIQVYKVFVAIVLPLIVVPNQRQMRVWHLAGSPCPAIPIVAGLSHARFLSYFDEIGV